MLLEAIEASPPHDEAALINASTLPVNRLVKKCIPALLHYAAPKMSFSACFIFNDLQSLKMPVHPCTANRLAKNEVFHQRVNASAFTT